MKNFKDHFSKYSDIYAKFRPGYPEALFCYVASQVKIPKIAWDCATGNGQAAIGLTPFFEKIEATDASEIQIQNAKKHKKITYSVLKAEKTTFPDSHFDLISVASGIHWFDMKAFYNEAKRVLKKNGVIAVWVYHGWNSTTRTKPPKVI